jgi:hypothetical protein
MNTPRKPIGKVPEVTVRILSYDEKINMERRQRNKERIVEAKDKTLIWLGKGLRSIVNTIDTDNVPRTENPRINKRAGKTAVAAIMLSAGLVVAGASYEASHTSKEDCEMITPGQLGDNLSAGEAATEVWGAYADLEGTNAYDQALEDFSTTGETLVCGEPYLSRLDLSD